MLTETQRQALAQLLKLLAIIAVAVALHTATYFLSHPGGLQC